MNKFGRNKFQQAMFGLNKFINRRILGKDNVEFMPQYQPVEGVMYGQLPTGYKQTEDVAFKKSAEFNKKEKGRDDLDDILKQPEPIDFNTGDPTAGVKGQDTKGFLIDFLERDILRRQNERNALRLNQALTNQETAALSERNRQALANQLAFTKFDTTQIAKNQLRAAQREGELKRAIAVQASAGAQIGGLGTGRRFGRG